jgi:hypothetical protein
MPTPEQVIRYNATRKAKYKINPEPMKRASNNCYRSRYGWTPEMYEAKKKEQNNLCEICGQTQGYKELAADHAHTDTPTPRGLLCDLCNRALGLFRESPEVLRAAALYIERYR